MLVINTVHQIFTAFYHLSTWKDCTSGPLVVDGVVSQGLMNKSDVCHSRPEHLTVRARLSRAVLSSIMVINDIQDVDASLFHPDVELTLDKPGWSCGMSNK